MIGRLKADSFMLVRREALYGVVKRLPELAPVHLRAALLDRHPSMRDAARFYLRQNGEQDFARFYREMLDKAEGQRLLTAIAGLGEAGVAQDAQRLAPLLQHFNSRVRRAAVRAVGRLDAPSFVEQLAIALQDHSPSVAKSARDVILAHPHLLSSHRLWSIFQATDKTHVRRIVLMLVNRLSWWDSAPLLVLAAGSPDEDISERAVNYLHRWQRNANRLAMRPNRAQLQILDDALKQHASALDQPARDDLETVLLYARRELI